MNVRAQPCARVHLRHAAEPQLEAQSLQLLQRSAALRVARGGGGSGGGGSFLARLGCALEQRHLGAEHS